MLSFCATVYYILQFNARVWNMLNKITLFVSGVTALLLHVRGRYHQCLVLYVA